MFMHAHLEEHGRFALMQKRILIVDDDPATTQSLARLLTAKGFLVNQVNDSTQALKVAREFQPDFVILDFLMPEMHGGDVAWQLASDAALEKTPLFILTSGASPAEFATALPPVRISILEKPIATAGLLRMLEEPQAA